MMDRLDKGVSEIPADLDLECPPGFVKGLPPRTTVFKETLKTSSQYLVAKLLAIFKGQTGWEGAALRV